MNNIIIINPIKSKFIPPILWSLPLQWNAPAAVQLYSQIVSVHSDSEKSGWTPICSHLFLTINTLCLFTFLFHTLQLLLHLYFWNKFKLFKYSSPIFTKFHQVQSSIDSADVAEKTQQDPQDCGMCWFSDRLDDWFHLHSSTEDRLSVT